MKTEVMIECRVYLNRRGVEGNLGDRTIEATTNLVVPGGIDEATTTRVAGQAVSIALAEIEKALCLDFPAGPNE